MREKKPAASKKIPGTASSPVINDPVYLVDIPEAARRLSTTVFAVRGLIRSNKLKFISVGHKQLISPAAIQEFIAANETYYGAAQSSPDRVAE
jgi:excisionase family DNA binding protein